MIENHMNFELLKMAHLDLKYQLLPSWPTAGFSERPLFLNRID